MAAPKPVVIDLKTDPNMSALTLATQDSTGQTPKTATQLDAEKKQLVRAYLEANPSLRDKSFVAFHQGSNEWLSNTYKSPFRLAGRDWNSPENYYQSQKITKAVGNGSQAFLNEDKLPPNQRFTSSERQQLNQLLQTHLANCEPQEASNAATGKGRSGIGHLNKTLIKVVSQLDPNDPLKKKVDAYAAMLAQTPNKPRGGYYGLNDLVPGAIGLSKHEKYNIMSAAQTAKYNDPRNSALKNALLSTGNATIIEAAPDDITFGLGNRTQLSGLDQEGYPHANLQGHITANIRTQLQLQARATQRADTSPPAITAPPLKPTSAPITPPPAAPRASSPVTTPPSRSPADKIPPKQATNSTIKPTVSLFKDHHKVKRPYRPQDLEASLLTHKEIPEILDQYLVNDKNQANQVTAAKVLATCSVKNVMRSLAVNADITMVENNQKGSTAASGKPHDDTAMKVTFNTKEDALQFTKALYEEHGIHSHTFGEGYMKSPQGKNGNIVFLTKEDLNKIAQRTQLSEIQECGALAYDAIKSQFILSKPEATIDTLAPPKPSSR